MIPYFESDFPEESQWKEKILNIKRKIKNDPEKIELYKQYTRLLLENSTFQNIKEAEKSIRKYLKVGDNNNDNASLIFMMKIMRLSNRKNDALNLAEQLENKNDNQNNADFLEQYARIFWQNGNLSEAKELSEAAHKKFPDHNGLARILVMVLIGLEKNSEALILLNKICRVEPKNPRNTFYVIQILFHLGNIKEAIRIGESFCDKYKIESFQQLPITDYDSVVFSLAHCYFEYGESLRGKNHLKFTKKESEKQISHISELGNEAPEYYDKASKICDEILKNETQTSHPENVLRMKLSSLVNLEKFEESFGICEELLLNIKEDIFEHIDILRIRISLMSLLKQYEKVIKYSDEFIEKYIQYEDAENIEIQIYFVLETRLFSYYNLGHLEKYKKEQTRMEEKYGEEAERKKLKKKCQVPDVFMNLPGQVTRNTNRMKEIFEEFEDVIFYVDHYIKKHNIDHIMKLLDFEKIKFHEIRFLGKIAYANDGGKEWWTNYSRTKGYIDTFNADHKSKCKMVIKHYAQEDGEDKIHNRMFLDSKILWSIPGNDQISAGDVDVWAKIPEDEDANKTRMFVRKKWKRGLENKELLKKVIEVMKENNPKNEVYEEIERELKRISK